MLSADDTQAEVRDHATRNGFDTRVGAYCVLIEHGGLLLAHLASHLFDRDEWTLPGGGLEPFESPEQAAVRELYEETGLNVALTGLLAVDSFTIAPHERILEADRERALLSLRVVYRAVRTSGTLRREVNGSTDDVAWIPLHEVPRLSRVELVDVALNALSAR